MLKKTLAKAVAGTTAAAGIFLVPGLVAGPTSLSLSACDISAAAMTVSVGASTITTNNTPVSGTATITSTVPGFPAGEVTVSAQSFSGGYGSTTILAGPTTSNSVSYTLPGGSGNGQTTRIWATFQGVGECGTVTKNSAYRYVTKLKIPTTTSITPAGNTLANSHTATVTQDRNDSGSSGVAGVPTGTVTFAYNDYFAPWLTCSATNKSKTLPLSSGAASATRSTFCVLASATYNGDGNYETSVDDTP